MFILTWFRLCLDYGECGAVVNFMFMPLCGKSLESIQREKVPTIGTAIILSEQCLRAVQNFHTISMNIHRKFIFNAINLWYY